MSANKKCFVIFPFKEPYESRYKNIYEPALRNAGLKVVRAGDPGVEVIIEDIQKHIKESLICFADLTEENANVWYEVGYAYACEKKVVMVCDKDKCEFNDLPFDIKHRSVIGYSEIVDTDKDALLSFAEEITKDAKAKMANAQKAKVQEAKVQKATLAKKDIPKVYLPVVSPRNHHEKFYRDDLTKNDIKVLKEIVNYHLRNKDTSHYDFHNSDISNYDLQQKLKPIMRLLIPEIISELLRKDYIEKGKDRNIVFSKGEYFTITPTKKALRFAKENSDLF